MVEWIRLDSTGHEISRTPDPSDTYDPRQRPWYVRAMNTEGVAWTGVYVFFTDHVPGITASRMHAERGGNVNVFGADIRLDELSHFLAGLKIGSNGRVLIFDANGTVVALPDMKRMLRHDGDATVAARLDQLNDPVLLAAYDRFRVEGLGRRIITLDDIRYITMVSHIPAAGSDWSVMIVVPERDFTGFIAANRRVALTMSLAVVALTTILAALLVIQGLRADRAARMLLQRSRAIERQSTAFSALATQVGLLEIKPGEATARLTELLVEAGDSKRASIWSVTGGGLALRCEDAFERESGGHTLGLEIARAEAPELFVRLLAGNEVSIADLTADRTAAAAWIRSAMLALGSVSVFIVPVRGPTGVVGAIWLENAEPSTHDFARVVANMLSLRMGNSDSSRLTGARPQNATLPPEAQAIVPSQSRSQQRAATHVVARSLNAELLARSLGPGQVAAEVFPEVAVLFLHFDDPAKLAAPLHNSATSQADGIACILQDCASQHDIPYLKIMGQSAVAAAGFGTTDPDALFRVARLALALRDHLFDLCDATGDTASFHIGVHSGIAIGGQIGREPRIYNLWGEAVEVASVMASSATAGTIQVTQTAYGTLARDFLFRPHGSFWLPRSGEMGVFELAAAT